MTYKLDSDAIGNLIGRQVQLVAGLQQIATQDSTAENLKHLTEALNYALYGLNELVPLQRAILKEEMGDPLDP